MSALDTFKRLITFQPGPINTVISLKSTPTTEVYGPLGQRPADWSGVDTNGLSRSYRLCATAYACTTFLADAVSESPLKVYRIVNGELVEQPEHRLRRLMVHPNPAMSEAEFIGVTVMSMGMFGYAVIEKVRSAARLPVELWPLRPDWLHQERANNGEVHWVYRQPRRDPRIIAGDDLILVPYRHDERQEQVGVSPLQIVAREIAIDVSLTDLLKVFLDAGGIPPWAVELPESSPKQAEVDTFREQWKQRYGGWSAYANIGILYGGMKLVKVGDSIGDMAWPDLRGLVEMKIAQAFRVPADLIQARDSMKSGSLTTTEIDGAMAALQSFGATPLRQRIDGAFTRALLPDFVGADPTYTIEFDTSDILSLQEDRNAKHARVRDDFSARMITLNEARAELGYVDLGEAGNVFPVLFNVTFLRPDELAGTNANAPLFAPVVRDGQTQAEAVAVAGDKSQLPSDFAERLALQRSSSRPIKRVYVDRKSLSDIESKARANVLGQTNRNRQKLSEIGTRQLRKFFKDQGARVIDSLKSDGAMSVKAPTLNWAEEDDLLEELMNRYYDAIGKSAYGQVGNVTGTELSWDVANPNVSRVMDQLALRVKDISETTMTDVQKVVADGLANGLNHVELAKELTGLFEETYKNRALTIARTESMLAYNTASRLGYEESGMVDQVEMVDNPDHTDSYNASDGLTCAERDGLRVDLADVDGHVQAEHPNGSLAIIPILNRTLGE